MKDVYAYWSLEMLQEEANKYKTRGEFQKNSRRAYGTALKRKVLNIVCSHMKPSRGSSMPERELLEIIKKFYPEARSIRDMSVKIPNKPYIKGFDIDILVGNRGIEFDGTWTHSFEGLRRSKRRSEWSDKDIRNYHKYKNDHFMSKGIQILHIREDDWIKDRKLCIELCLSFLENSYNVLT